MSPTVAPRVAPARLAAVEAHPLRLPLRRAPDVLLDEGPGRGDSLRWKLAP